MLALAARFLVDDPGAPELPCDGCGAPRTHHVPVCGEHDPYLISFWVSLCDRCLQDQKRGQIAVKSVSDRGWARPGIVPDESEMPKRDDALVRALLGHARG